VPTTQVFVIELKKKLDTQLTHIVAVVHVEQGDTQLMQTPLESL
jgi:hypothetical protein